VGIKRTKLAGPGDFGHEFPASFAVLGRGTVQSYVEFRAPMPGFTFTRGDYDVRIEAITWPRSVTANVRRLDQLMWAKLRRRRHPSSWATLVKFTLHVTAPEQQLGQFLSYSNLPIEDLKMQGTTSPLQDLLKELKLVDDARPRA
jgi:hypothetical protein